MTTIISVSENGLIGSADQWAEPPPSGIIVPDAVFQALRQIYFADERAEGLLTFSVQKGRELIRIRNYVGLLPLNSRMQLEILPKIGNGNQARSLLLCMIRCLRQSSFRTLPAAHTQALPLPLWDVFITAFLDSVEPLVRQGVQHDYVSLDRNERFWKGKFQAVRQQRENAQHAERLAVVYDVRTIDTPPNRILKTVLVYLKQQTIHPANQRRMGQLMAALADVPCSESLPDDRRAIRRSSRLFTRYEPALRWAEALLQGRGFGVKAGQTLSLSLLFPMERVFEAYVSHGLRTYWPDTDDVRVQESSVHLVDEHVGTPKFKLRPDVIIRQNDRTFVLDMKWKQINDTGSGTGNYGIEQADLYQLYAYGKKYAANDLFLVYPASETFSQPLPVFGYDAITRLHVVPFDVTQPLVNEVEKLASYALSFH